MRESINHETPGDNKKIKIGGIYALNKIIGT
jgi:hypothetical protein